MNNFSKTLKEMRKRRGIRQIDLAKKIEVTQATISSWEIGRTSPTLDQLLQLSNILKVSIDYLIRGE